jgi:glycosyltransferase involved in cell wall biosynthesis
MKLEWDTRIDMRDQNILLHERNSDNTARVTIGLPTFRRGHLIRRALASIAAQTYRNFVLIISDNAGEDATTMAVVQEFSEAFPEVVLVAQDENIGVLGNYKFVLAAAQTEYFMWLADDDELSADYLEELVGLLDADPGTVTAMGRWMGMTSPTDGTIRLQLRSDEARRLHRLFKFVACNAEDSAFYGVHRTEGLRQSRFTDYLPPNRGVLTNFCYIMLFDMLWIGRFQYGRSACWTCHNYSEKKYNHALAKGFLDRVRTFLRRLNVYLIYIGKTARKGPILIPAILVASLLGFTRDIVTATWRLTNRSVRHRLSAKTSAKENK